MSKDSQKPNSKDEKSSSKEQKSQSSDHQESKSKDDHESKLNKINGTSGNDIILGTAAADRINGLKGDDIITAGDGDDFVHGNNGNDVIEGGAGNDKIYGNAGIDTAVFNGSILDYSWVVSNEDDHDEDHEDDDHDGGDDKGWFEGKVIITDLNTADGDTGVDTLKHIENLQFNDFTFNVTGNNAPLLISADSQATDEDTALTFALLAYDFDGDAVAASVVAASGASALETGSSPLTTSMGSGTEFTISYDSGVLFQYLAVGESTNDTVTIEVSDGNGGTSTKVVNISIAGVNDAPTLGAAIAAGGTEDDAAFSVDLLDGASDVDTSDTLSASNLALISGIASGVTISGNSLTVDPSAYNNLAFNESEVITYSYDVTDGNGGSVAQTATATIAGVNDAPTVGAAIAAGGTEDDAAFSVDLLDGANDVDTSDTLSVSNLALNSGIASGITISGNSLNVDPSAYNSLAINESEVITYSYDVTDGNGGSAAQTATITINGLNDAPVINGGSTSGNVSEDNVLTVSGSLIASDVDTTDLFSWSGGGASTYGALTIDANGNWEYILNNASTAVQSLNTGDVVNDIFNVEVSDGNGGVTSTSINVALNGVDDGNPPVPIEDVSTDFENGFAGWQTIGATSVVPSNTGIGNMARIDGTGATEAQVEAFLGAEIPNSYSGQTGSAIMTTLTLHAGDVVSFDYFFQANDYMPYNDFAVYMGIDGTMNLLSNVAAVGNYGNSGWQTVHLPIANDGVYDIGFAGMNAFDTILWPQLYVDNLIIL